ncbi:MAG: hypothetical protein ACREMQ_04410 [Longimicrobiales bacterium]
MDEFDIAPSKIGESAQRTKLESEVRATNFKKPGDAADDRPSLRRRHPLQATPAKSQSSSQSAATLHITVKSRFGAGSEYDGPWAAVLAAWAIKQTTIILVIWLAGSAAAPKLLALFP